MPRRQQNLLYWHNVHNKWLLFSMYLQFKGGDFMQKALYPKFDSL